MLTHIAIQNFVLVEKLNLDFSAGLHVLTGETGAGKSIWVDAIALALGGRADASVIRQSQARCDITLCFNLNTIPAAREWLAAHEFDSAEEECLIRRVIQADGPSRSTINGAPCPLHLVREFGALVLTIHSQHQHQDLLKTDGQQQQLDHFAGHENILRQIRELYQQWQTNAGKIAALQATLSNRNAELDLLRYQINELAQLNLKDNEWQTLSEQHKQFHHAVDWRRQLQQALEFSVDDEKNAALNQINRALVFLNHIKSPDESLTNAKILLNNAIVQLEECGDVLRDYSDRLTLEPEKLAEIEQRLNLIHDLARKHRVTPNDLLTLQNQLTDKIAVLENAESALTQLEAQQTQILNQYKAIAEDLSRRREKTAQSLDKKVTEWMQQLGMKGGRFHIALEKIEEPIHPLGNERIRFQVSANPGQDLQPLQKVASGGELSRLHLALQVIIAQKEQTPTLIFDEADVGIGGQTAAIVGKLLRQLGEKTQVLCITHLPQVAAYGHHHYRVSKKIEKKTTRTEIQPLTAEERTQELARMLGGEKITDQTLLHASEMLKI